MWNIDFWIDAAERAIKTAAQSALLVLAAEQLDALTVDWLGLLGYALGGAVLSVLSSIASSRVGYKGSPSFLE